MTEQSPQNFTLYIACTKLRKVYNKGVQQEILTNAVHDPAAFLWEWNCISPSQGNGHGTIFRKSEEIECLLKISRLDQSSFILAIFALFSLIVPLLNAFASL